MKLLAYQTMKHLTGMGILAQLSHNIRVNNCKVTPSHGRMLSTTADATHFVNCTGYIKLTNNLFENQKDDATNIHGTYVQVVEIAGPDTVLVQLKHRQQHGFDFLYPGVEVEFVHGKSMITFATSLVKEAVRLNKEFTRVTFDSELPAELTIGDALAAIREYPEVTIAGNTIRNNRARGMLLNSRGKTLVENNYFHTPGAAILFEGDSFFWFEQGGVSDCVIRNNIFDNCLFGVWGKAVIDVKAGLTKRTRILPSVLAT
jgi:parallel beta-helix repeat protein